MCHTTPPEGITSNHDVRNSLEAPTVIFGFRQFGSLLCRPAGAVHHAGHGTSLLGRWEMAAGAWGHETISIASYWGPYRAFPQTNMESEGGALKKRTCSNNDPFPASMQVWQSVEQLMSDPKTL